MPCTDPRAGYEGQLFKFATAGGDTVTRGKLVLHLKECQSCRRRLADIFGFFRVVRSADRNTWAPATPCADSEDMVRFSEDPGALSEEKRNALMRHVRECPSCNKDLCRLLRLNQDMHCTGFGLRTEIPKHVANSLNKLVRRQLRSGALNNRPLNLELDCTTRISNDVCREISNREFPGAQESISVMNNVVSGYVSDDQGRPLPHETVCLMRNGASIYRIQSDSSGGFLFDGLVQGWYELEIRNIRTLLIVKKGRL